MDHISYHHRLEPSVHLWLYAKHFKPTYWLASYDRETGKVFRLTWMDRKDPAGIQGLFPVYPGHECALIQVTQYGAFKWVGWPYHIINT